MAACWSADFMSPDQLKVSGSTSWIHVIKVRCDVMCLLCVCLVTSRSAAKEEVTAGFSSGTFNLSGTELPGLPGHRAPPALSGLPVTHWPAARCRRSRPGRAAGRTRRTPPPAAGSAPSARGKFESWRSASPADSLAGRVTVYRDRRLLVRLGPARSGRVQNSDTKWNNKLRMVICALSAKMAAQCSVYIRFTDLSKLKRCHKSYFERPHRKYYYALSAWHLMKYKSK